MLARLTSLPCPVRQPQLRAGTDQPHASAAGAGVQAGGRQDTPVYLLRDLQPGHAVPGPAIVLDDISTVVVEPACTAHVTPAGDLRVDVGTAAAGPQRTPTECDPIQLAIFSHRCGRPAGRSCEQCEIRVDRPHALSVLSVFKPASLQLV